MYLYLIAIFVLWPYQSFGFAKNKGQMDAISTYFSKSLPQELRTIKHKLPMPGTYDSSINLQNITTNVIQDLFGPINGKHSTLTPSEISKRNQLVIEAIEALPWNGEGIEPTEAIDLVKQAIRNPVVGLSDNAKDKYDPKVDGVRKHGFCFGRADFLYFHLRAKGLSAYSMLKFFQVGLINADKDFGRPWINHNVIIVRSTSGKWLALDPFYQKKYRKGVLKLKTVA